MRSRKRQCPRQARMHRHCLDSLEIPFPISQTQPSTCQDPPISYPSSPVCQRRPLNCWDPDFNCPVQPTACVAKPPECPPESLACEIKPPHCQFIPLTCQFRPPACQRPTSCVDQPSGCQVKLPACPPICQFPPPVYQFSPPTCPNQLPCMMKQPICQWDQEFCTVDTTQGTDCRINRQSPHNICHSYSDDDDNAMYSDCFGPCTNTEGGCKNLEENDLDHPHFRDGNTSSRTNQNGNRTSNHRNDEENLVQVDRNEIPNDINVSTQSEKLYDDINKIPVSGENSPQMSDNSDSNNLRQTLPCCQPGYFKEQALQPDFDIENEALASEGVTLNTSTTRKSSISFQSEKYLTTSPEDEPLESNHTNISPVDKICQNHTNISPVGKICQTCCDTRFDEMPNYLTRPEIDNNHNDGYQEQQTGPTRERLQGQHKQFNMDDNINADKHFKQNYRDYRDATKEHNIPHIDQRPRSAMKSSSNIRPASKSKVHIQESNGIFMDCDTCCEQNSNLQESGHSEFRSEHVKSQTRFADQRGQSVFENSVPAKGPKQFASCCNHGISGVLVDTPESPENIDIECNKDVACVQKAGTSSCASTTCDVNVTVSGCSCRYPPAFKQLSCAGNINGTCTCIDKNKI